MDPAAQRYQKLSNLFEQALPMPLAEAKVWLEEQCPNDKAQVQEVLDLLQQDRKQSPLDKPITELSRMYLESKEEDANPPTLPEIPGFKIHSILAQGTTGTVYKAEQEQPKRMVALKIMLPSGVHSQSLRRFELECKILARLNHPNIGMIFSAGSIGSGSLARAYFAMEFIDGISITQFSDQQTFSIEKKIELMQSVCEAVHHAHTLGIVHRDLKPANILVRKDHQPKVLDFGVALVRNPEITTATMATQHGQLVGTLAYMSPEQCEGTLVELDARSDVYALGLILYQLIAGRLPYDLNGLTVSATIQRIQTQPPKAIPGKNNRVLNAILNRALAKDPRNRYATAADFSADLTNYLQGRSTQASPPSLGQKTWRLIQAHPVLSTGFLSASLGAGFLMISMLVNTYLTGKPSYVTSDTRAGFVSLRSANGALIRTWETGPKGVTHGQFLAADPSSNSVGNFLLGYSLSTTQKDSAGILYLYDVQDLDNPIWTSESIPHHIPAPTQPGETAKWAVSSAQAFDFFPSIPGVEILVVGSMSPYSPTSLSIHAFNGELVYQVWHNGFISYLRWIPEQNILFCSGLNSESNWVSRGYPELGTVYPSVLFTLKLEPYHISDKQWIVENGKILDPGLVWYKWVGPIEHLAQIGTARAWSRVEGTPDGMKVPLMVLEYGEYMDWKAHITLTIDAAGNSHDGYGNDAFNSALRLGLLPPVSEIMLMPYSELPPLE